MQRDRKFWIHFFSFNVVKGTRISNSLFRENNINGSSSD